MKRKEDLEKTAQEQNDEDDYLLDEDEIILDDCCPKCGREYDEIDYEYQICHRCKFNNNGKP